MKSELKNLMDVVLKLGDWVNTLTNFSIIMNLAVIGWLFSSKDPWPLAQRLVVAGGYTVFATYNLFSQHRTHSLLQITLNELKEAVAQNKDTEYKFYTDEFAAMLQRNRQFNLPLIIIGHIVIDIAMNALILFSYVWK